MEYKMKKLLSMFLVSMSMFFVSCSNMEVGFEPESVFYSGGVVYIYLDKDMKSDEKYKVFINGENTDISLMTGYKTRFRIKPGNTIIKILHGTETADINLTIDASKNYYLQVRKDNQDKMEIMQIEKKSISKEVKNTPLYVDEKEVPEKISKKEASKQDTMKTEEKSVEKSTESKTTFYYNPLDGE